MIGIYKITNPNGKIYIGQSINIEKRIIRYKNLYDCKNQSKLYNSFIKYGIINHNFDIVEECEISELNIRERYYQDYYNVLNKGLNLKLTNLTDNNGPLSEETKLKIKISLTGHSPSKIARLNMSKAQRGKKMSEESKIKNSISKKGGNNPRAKKVICTKTNKIWKCIRECALELNIKPLTLCRNLNGTCQNKTTIRYYTDE